MKTGLTQKRLKELFYYDPDIGIFTHKVIRRGRGKKGNVAGNRNALRYVTLGIDNKVYYAHHLVFLYMEGKFPQKDIDHINQIIVDNRLCNLRQVTRSENSRNRKIASNNKTGCMGVYFYKERKRWTAEIHLENNRIYLGSFNKKQDAIDARKLAEIKYGYHPNHGK